MITKEVLPEKIKDRSYLLHKIQQKHPRWNTARSALLIGAGCSHPILPLGGGLIKICQQLCYIRHADPVSSAHFIEDFLRNGDISPVDAAIKEKGIDGFDSFVKGRENVLLNRIERNKALELKRLPEGSKWDEYQQHVLADAKYGYWMDEYSESPKERQRLIEALVESKNPGGAYIVLAYLIEKGFFSNILTSNFDDFVNDSLLYYTGTKPRFYADDELSQYISIYSAKPNIIKLHGDYRYANIRNTTEETANLSKRLEVKLRELLTELDIMIVGYNGADYSIMNVLQQVKSPDCELLWCGLNEKDVHWRVADLINNTANSYFIKIKGFDDLMGDFYLEFLKTPPEDLVDKAKRRQSEIAEYVKQFSKELKDKAETEEEKIRLERLEKQEEMWKLWSDANKNKEYNLQILLLNKILEIDPLSVRALYTRGYAYHMTKEYDKAIDDCSKALALDDKSDFAYNNRGCAYANAGEYDKSLADLDKAIQLNPSYALRYTNRANTHYGMGRYDKAVEDYTMAIGLDKQNASYYDDRGYLYCVMGKYQEAIQDYDTGISIDSNSAKIFIGRGYVYKEMKEYEKAIADCDRGIEMDGTKSEFYNQRGNTYYAWDKMEESIVDYTRAIELKGNEPMYYFHRGNAYYSLSRFEDAVKDYSKAIEMKPTYKEAYGQRAKAYEELNDNENAKKDLEMVEQLASAAT